MIDEETLEETGRHDERCPSCGRFVSKDEGFCDLPPGGIQDRDLPVAYCDDACAEQKDPAAIYADDPAWG